MNGVLSTLTTITGLLPSSTSVITVIDTATGCGSNPISFTANALPDPSDCEEFTCGDLFVPTVFSPNGDLNNDVFRIKIEPACVQEMDLMVFDRWGKLIFQTTNPEEAWDGTDHGKELNAAVFVYSLKIKLINESETLNLSSNVSLFK